MSRLSRISPRRVAAAALAAAGALAATSGVAAADAPAKTDEIVFTSHAYLAPQPDGTTQAALISDTCTIASNGGSAKPCWLSLTGTIRADGTGEAKAVLVSDDRVITFDETFASTSPTTGVGTGTVRVHSGSGPKKGTFVGPYELAPTADPNVLLDWGTITITY